MRRFAFVIALAITSSIVVSADWPMWGGAPSRNMVSPLKGMPTSWDVKSGKNVKWVAELGSQSYGNPTVAGGVVLIGTNNEATRDPKQPGDRGVVMAFREATGEPEPAAWTVEKTDKIAHLEGSPGIYGDGISDWYFDNVSVYPNK